jgi:hypothetical protein
MAIVRGSCVDRVDKAAEVLLRKGAQHYLHVRSTAQRLKVIELLFVNYKKNVGNCG